jgi:hypothetical protein
METNPLYIIVVALATDIPTSNESKRQKRLRDENIVLSDDDSDGNFPSFIVVEAADGQPIKYSNFAIKKMLMCAVGETMSKAPKTA